jgi:hypothetical protein
MNNKNYIPFLEALEDAKRVLGDNLGSLYMHLKKEFHHLEYKWLEYKELFGVKESRIDLLNQTAPRFFYYLQNTLFEDALLHIARMLDNKSVSGKKTLSLLGLDFSQKDVNFQAQLKIAIDKLQADASFCRDWRNRTIAHNDLQLTKENAVPLEEATRDKVSKCIEDIRAILNLISEKFFDSTFTSLVHPTGAWNLLYYLSKGLGTVKKQREEMKNGKFVSHYDPDAEV